MCIRDRFFVLISLFFFTQTIHAQTISGRIIDKKTGEGLIFANVILLKDGIQKAETFTDLDGNYTFEYTSHSENKFYDIQAVYIGYETEKMTRINLEMVLKIEVNLEMTEAYTEYHGYGPIGYPRYKHFSPPLIDLQNTSTGQILNASDIKRRF